MATPTMTPEQIFDSKADCYADRFDKDERLTPAMTKKVFVDIMSRSFADMVREKLPPLEWWTQTSSRRTVWWVETLIGAYRIHQDADGGKFHLRNAGRETIGSFPTLDEAKAAAQEHYTDKVLEIFGIQKEPDHDNCH